MQKFINRRCKFLKAILIRIANNTYTRNNLDDKWIKLFPTLDKGQLRCYLSQIS